MSNKKPQNAEGKSQTSGPGALGAFLHPSAVRHSLFIIRPLFPPHPALSRSTHPSSDSRRAGRTPPYAASRRLSTTETPLRPAPCPRIVAVDVGAAVFCGGCCGCHAESRRAGIEASRRESVSYCRSPTPLCVRSLPAVAGVLCVEGRLPLPLSFVNDRWALDMDYCFFAVPTGVYYRYPSSGAGAVMNRLTNLATSFPSPDNAPRPPAQDSRRIVLRPNPVRPVDCTTP